MMIDFDIKPYPGEDEISVLKRKTYFIREVKPRIDYHKIQIERKSKNTEPLTAVEKEEIDVFWKQFLPGNLKDFFLDYRFYEFYKKVLKDDEHLCDYMPDIFYMPYIDEFFTDPQHTRTFDDKNLYDVYFHDVPKPRTIFRKIQDTYLDENYRVISQEEAVEKACALNEVILKVARYSCAGKGVKFWSHKDGNQKQDLLDFLGSSTYVLCQEVIKQHVELNRLNPNSINTVRVMTLFFDNRVHLLSSVIRMSVNDSRVDNASSGGIVCGVKDSGQLKENAFTLDGDYFPKHHPKGTIFESVAIPNFGQCLDISKKLATRFSTFSKLISWDFAIDEFGRPLLIEFNLTWGGLDLHQLCNGPIFGDMTEDVLKEVFANSYTLNSIIKSLKS